MHRLPLLAAVAATASLGGAASATAATAATAATTTYQATLQADFVWSYATHEQSASGAQHAYARDEEGKYGGRVTSVNPFVQFEDGRILPYRAGNGASDVNASGGRSITIKDSWSGDSKVTCTSDGAQHYKLGRSAFGPAWGGRIGVRLFDELEVPEVCSDGTTTGGIQLHNEGAEVDDPTEWVGPFDTPADWSADTIGPAPGAGKVVQRVVSDVSDPQHCPVEDDSGTITDCKFSFEGTITYVRQDLIATDGVEPVQNWPTTPTTPTTPASPGVPAPGSNAGFEQAAVDAVSQAVRDHLQAPAPAPAPAPATSTDAMVDAVSSAIRDYLEQSRPTVRSDRAQADVLCPGPCTGTLSAEAVARQNAANGTPLGSVVFRDLSSVRAPVVTAQRMRAVLRFSKADRRALERRRFVALTLRVKPVGAAQATVVRKVVRAPRRR